MSIIHENGKHIAVPSYKEPKIMHKDLILAEFHEIKKLIPPKGISREKRAGLNSIIRRKLPLLDIRALGLLYTTCDHDLSAREIEKRLDVDSIDNLGDLLGLCSDLNTFGPEGINTKRRCRLTVKIFDNLGKRAESFNPEDIVNYAEKYKSDIIEQDLLVFERIISKRNDRDEIVKILESRGTSEKLSLNLLDRF